MIAGQQTASRRFAANGDFDVQEAKVWNGPTMAPVSARLERGAAWADVEAIVQQSACADPKEPNQF
jgi:hypothetical protein